MNRILLTLGLLATTLASNAQTNYPGGIPGCVARYSFSVATPGILSDASGNNNNGIASNLTAVPGWKGNANAAMQFNGSSSSCQVANSTTLNPQQFTLVALVKFNGFYAGKCQYSMMMAKGAPGFVNGVYTLGVTDQIYSNDCDVFDGQHIMRSDYFGPNTFITPSSPVLQTNKWYLMITTYDGSTWSAYQVEMDSTNLLPSIAPIFTVANINGAVGSNTMPLTIGKMESVQYPYWLNGTLDEEAIFNRALANSEVYKIYYFLHNGYPLGVTEALNQEAVNAKAIGGILHLESSDSKPIGRVMIYNVQGQVIANKAFTGTQDRIDLRGLPQAMLFAKILHAGVILTIKVPNF